MKKQVFVVAIFISLILVACGKELCTAEGCKNEAVENGLCNAHIQLAEMQSSEEQVTDVEEVEEKQSLYSLDPITIDDVTYTYAEFDEYNSPAEENGHGGEKKFIIGKLGELAQTDEYNFCDFYTQNNGTWLVNFPPNKQTRWSLMNKLLEADEILLCGEYPGFSEVYKEPVIHPEYIYIDEEQISWLNIIKGEWRENELKDTKTIQEISFLEPDEIWERKESESSDSKAKYYYYYPYESSAYGMVYIAYVEREAGMDTSYYKDIIRSAANKDEIFYEQATAIDGVSSYKSLFNQTINDDLYQVLIYITMGDKYYYTFSFVDYYELTPEMEAFAEEFMSNVKVNVSGKPEKIENDPNYDYEAFNKEVEKQLNEKKESTSNKSSGYQAILDKYSEKLKVAAPKLAQEYKTEATGISDIEKKAEICNDKVGDLAKISNDGISEMAEYMYKTKGSYDEYSKWADKLMDVYMDEADKIMDAYMNSAL